MTQSGYLPRNQGRNKAKGLNFDYLQTSYWWIPVYSAIASSSAVHAIDIRAASGADSRLNSGSHEKRKSYEGE
jgi:hypothetical protein